MEKEKGEEEERHNNWSETVEDLVADGDTDAAVSLLNSVVSKLQSSVSSDTDSQLASVLSVLANLHSSQGFSLKADEIESKSLALKQQQEQKIHRSSSVLKTVKENVKKDDQTYFHGDHSVLDASSSRNGDLREQSTKSPDNAFTCERSSDDDWEAIADRAPDELLSSQCLPGVSKISLEDAKAPTPKRRGRGTFSYKKDELYSEQLSDKSSINDTGPEDVSNNKSDRNSRNPRYGTRHVLVLAGFSPSTRTIELEKLFDDFRDSGVVVRWVNDTVALAVFPTPPVALEAHNHLRCPFTVRVLDEDDILLSSIPQKDLEPPRQRPKTSARTAQRLIAQGMGLKLPSTVTGSSTGEFRKQEENRRNRIVTRQKLRDDAWGGDDA